MSGHVDSDGELWNEDKYGSLCSASPVGANDKQAFVFVKDGGGLYNGYHRDYARPCLFVVE